MFNRDFGKMVIKVNFLDAFGISQQAGILLCGFWIFAAQQ